MIKYNPLQSLPQKFQFVIFVTKAFPYLIIVWELLPPVDPPVGEDDDVPVSQLHSLRHAVRVATESRREFEKFVKLQGEGHEYMWRKK